MPLPVPNLDDRKFQDILDEARRLIPRYCPEWTDHNLSDPGITLLELFAWMTDMLLYRLNRVPDKNYVKFLELLDIRLQPARPATADITFRLTAPHLEDVVIPRGTEVATVRTDASEAITFATERDLGIRVPQLAHVLASRGGIRFHDYLPALEDPASGLGIFSDVPQENDALYFGFRNDVGGHTLLFNLQCRMQGIGIDPDNPPLIWEAWDSLETRWVTLTAREDTTRGLNGDGYIITDVPHGVGVSTVDEKPAYWARCRVVRPQPGRPGYSGSPRIVGINVSSLGGLVPANHAFKVEDEVLGISDGTPGQTVYLGTVPVLPRNPGETLEVERDDGSFERWTEVKHFGDSQEQDLHFVLDDVSGAVQLGPRVRSPGGRERQFGQVPPAGRTFRFTRYWSGGGIVGNVGAHSLSVLKSSIPYVAWVTNYAPALGGTDSEDLEHAKMRGPATLRRRERAVSPEDFEILAIQASPAVARARCRVVGGTVTIVQDEGQAGGGGAAGGDLDRLLSAFTGVRRAAASGRAAPIRNSARGAASPTASGFVRLLLVPSVRDATGPLEPEQLQFSARVRQDVHTYLDERRLLTCELVLGTPVYTWVSVSARVRARAQYDRALVATRAREALYRYIHPSIGGADGQGWPFGRELFIGEVYSQLQGVDGVDVIEEVTLFHIDPLNGASGPPVIRISPGNDGLLCSHEHHITVQ